MPEIYAGSASVLTAVESPGALNPAGTEARPLNPIISEFGFKGLLTLKDSNRQQFVRISI